MNLTIKSRVSHTGIERVLLAKIQFTSKDPSGGEKQTTIYIQIDNSSQVGWIE